VWHADKSYLAVEQALETIEVKVSRLLVDQPFADLDAARCELAPDS
jgi:hypothetical protein